MSVLLNRSRRDILKGSLLAAAGVSSVALLSHGAEAQSKDSDVLAPPSFAGFDGGAVGEDFWRSVRSRFRLDPNLTFLNNGTLGPAPEYVVATRDYYNHLLAFDPTDGFRSPELSEVRKQLAQFLHAQPDEVSITHSTTEGLNIFAHGLDWRQGDEVILGDQEHFGATEPYRTLAERYGVKLVTVNLPLPAESVDQVVAAYAQAFSPRTRVLVVSHVSYLTGLAAPLRELADLAHKHGALISVDGAQAFGVLPVDVKASNVDHYSGAGQKWLLAGTGTGVNYIRKELQGGVWPLYGFDDPAQKSSPRYERSGQIGIPAALGLAAALKFQNAIGKERIQSRALELGRRLRTNIASIPGARLLSSSDAALASNINVIHIPNLPPAQTAKLLAQRDRIVVRGLAQGKFNGLRVSTHFYNTPQQVDALLNVVAELAKAPPPFPTDVRTH